MNMLDAEEKLTVPPSLENYLELDLSPQSEAAIDLMAGVDAEATSDEISLSPLEGTQPADLTPQMIGWYQTYVAPLRVEALRNISQMFKSRGAAGKAEGFLLAIRQAEDEERLLSAKLRCYRDINQKHHNDNEEIQKLYKEIAGDANRYSDRKAALGRDARVLNKALYFSVLVIVIFGSEAALNLESFEALPWATPAIAWGATVIVGLAIGLAAHLHGTVLKQYEYYFGAAEDDIKRYRAWRAVGIGSSALIFSLSFIYYARSAYLTAFLGSVSAFGQSSTGYSSLWVIGGSLLGNILVYLTATIWAYLLHDSDPDYPELKIRLDEAESKLRALKQKLGTARQREIEQLNAIHKRQSAEAIRAYDAIMAHSNHKWHLELFAKLQAKDAQALALLHTYRKTLLQKISAAGRKTRFIAHLEDPYEQTKSINNTEYQLRSLKLKYLETN